MMQLHRNGFNVLSALLYQVVKDHLPGGVTFNPSTEFINKTRRYST